MAEYTLNILTPSVNNLTARVFMRAAGLDFEEVDVWGKTTLEGLYAVPGERWWMASVMEATHPLEYTAPEP